MTAAPLAKTPAATTGQDLGRARRGMPPLPRLIGHCLILLAVAWGATQVYFFVQIACWRYVEPSSTAFMRAGYWRLAHEGSDVRVEHTWVPYEQISRNLKRAIIASEDDTFVNNPGFDTDAMLNAWERNRQRGKIVRGGSTITQQLARNLFLSPEKSYLRKGQELIITAMLEFWMDKERILEIYLNSVEWGNGVYGAEAASQHYYKIPASRLNAVQAARLAVMLPQPRYYDAHPNSPYLRQRTGVIVRRMGSAELPH
jgi:monofunctional biosynthetic peptidoglycan transglycosylase